MLDSDAVCVTEAVELWEDVLVTEAVCDCVGVRVDVRVMLCVAVFVGEAVFVTEAVRVPLGVDVDEQVTGAGAPATQHVQRVMGVPIGEVDPAAQ